MALPGRHGVFIAPRTGGRNHDRPARGRTSGTRRPLGIVVIVADVLAADGHDDLDFRPKLLSDGRTANRKTVDQRLDRSISPSYLAKRFAASTLGWHGVPQAYGADMVRLTRSCRKAESGHDQGLRIMKCRDAAAGSVVFARARSASPPFCGPLGTAVPSAVGAGALVR